MIGLLISGGQTGADLGGLRVGQELEIPTGGWCPKGWRTDAGAAPWLATYGLKETATNQYAPRTILNVRMADAVIWVGNPFSPGGRLTLAMADREGREVYQLAFPQRKHSTVTTCAQDTRRWLERSLAWGWGSLMVAGNRERINPGIQEYTQLILREALRR